MTDTQVEANKLIAEFMGATPCIVRIKSIGDEEGYECEEYKLPTSELEYHTSWDWLMPVINKISLHQYDDKSWEGCPPYKDYAWPRTFGMISEQGKYLFRFNAQPLFEADNLIDAAYKAVVYFILNLNQTNSK